MHANRLFPRLHLRPHPWPPDQVTHTIEHSNGHPTSGTLNRILERTPDQTTSRLFASPYVRANARTSACALKTCTRVQTCTCSHKLSNPNMLIFAEDKHTSASMSLSRTRSRTHSRARADTSSREEPSEKGFPLAFSAFPVYGIFHRQQEGNG